MPTRLAPTLERHIALILKDLEKVEFKDLDKIEIVGIFPNYATAHAAWKSAAQKTVDNAQMRYFVVHMHRLLEPDEDDE